MDEYNSTHTGQEIDAAISRIKQTPGTGGITPAAIGAAPAGYGLGGMIEKEIPLNDSGEARDFNKAVDTGWYLIYAGNTHENAPDFTKVGYQNPGYSFMRVERYRYAVQTVYLCYPADVYIVRRISYLDDTNTWHEWEWINPRMIIGVEYRTTERWQGKAVYTKLVNCGALPNATLKQVAHGASAVQMIRCVGQSTSVYMDSLPFWHSDTDYCTIYASTEKIYIRSGSDLSERTATVQIWYTKD